ncbi:MAG: flagellar protein FliS [Syntrophomonadaceae bacterium]|nr:flagellar protein FliS [Syntrophomonadaceae bacterium]
MQANVKKDPAAIGEVRGFLVELREAWATAARRAGTVPAARQVQAGLALEG